MCIFFSGSRVFLRSRNSLNFPLFFGWKKNKKFYDEDKACTHHCGCGWIKEMAKTLFNAMLFRMVLYIFKLLQAKQLRNVIIISLNNMTRTLNFFYFFCFFSSALHPSEQWYFIWFSILLRTHIQLVKCAIFFSFD